MQQRTAFLVPPHTHALALSEYLFPIHHGGSAITTRRMTTQRLPFWPQLRRPYELSAPRAQLHFCSGPAQLTCARENHTTFARHGCNHSSLRCDALCAARLSRTQRKHRLGLRGFSASDALSAALASRQSRLACVLPHVCRKNTLEVGADVR